MSELKEFFNHIEANQKRMESGNTTSLDGQILVVLQCLACCQLDVAMVRECPETKCCLWGHRQAIIEKACT